MPKMKEMRHTVDEKSQNEKEHIMDRLESPKRPSPFLAEILFCTVWFVLQGIKGMVDTDVFYIISTGNYILSHGIPHTNPCVTTPGMPIVIQNWAYCVMIAWVKRSLGTVGLFILTILMIAGVYLVVRSLVAKTVTDPWVRLICTVILTNMFWYLNLRPEILTFLLIILELYGIEKYQQTGKKRYLGMIPVTMLAEVNFHASYWVMHLIVLLPYLVKFPCKRVTQTCMTGTMRRTLIFAAILSMPVLLANPYGLKNVTYVFDAMASGALKLMKISELLPFALNDLTYVLPIFGTILLFFYGLEHSVDQTEQGKILTLTSTAVWMWGGFLILVISKAKWYPFFMLGTLYLFKDMGNTIEDAMIKLWSRIRLDRATKLVLTICMAIMVVGLGKENTEPLRLIFTNQPLTDVYFARYADDTMLEDWKTVRQTVTEDLDPDICCLPPEYSQFFEYEGCQVYIDMRPELYINRKGEGSRSILENMVSIYNMRRNLTDTNLSFPFLMQKEKKNEKESRKPEKDSDFLSAKEYEALVWDIPAHYFLLANADRGGILGLFLEEHDGEYEKSYEGKNMTLYKKR